MSNGVFAYTAEQFAALFAQFSKATELARERQRDPQFVSRQLQSIIDPNIIGGTAGVFHVTGSFTSVAAAIEAGNYPLKWGIAERPQDIPAVIQPVDSFVRPVPLGLLTKAGLMFKLFPRLVDPMTLFAFGAKFPKEQEESPVFTIWMDGQGGLSCAILNVDDRRRRLGVCRVDPDDGFGGFYRVLVREFLRPPEADGK